MLNDDVFKIDKLQDGTFRVTRTDVHGDKHTHLRSRDMAKRVIHNVCNGKIPLNMSSYALESMLRLSTDDDYKRKIRQLLAVRKQKGRKDDYFNPAKK